MGSISLHIPNDDGEQLAVTLDLPDEGPPVAYAVVAHCFTCSKDLPGLRSIARAMVGKGFGVARLDFTGLGESEGDFSQTTFSSNASDLVATARYVAEHHGPVRLLVGHSFGGAAAIIAAHALPEVRAVVTIAAPSEPVEVKRHLTRWVSEIRSVGEAEVVLAGRPFRIREEFLDDLESHRMSEATATLGRPLLILHSPTDEVVGIDQATRIFEAARHPRSFIALDEADHLLTRREDGEFVGAMIATWARRYV